MNSLAASCVLRLVLEINNDEIEYRMLGEALAEVEEGKDFGVIVNMFTHSGSDSTALSQPWM